MVRTDSVFETALGLMLVVGGAGGWLGPDDFPDPVGTPLLVAFGCALLPIGALLWRFSNGPLPPRLLRSLATANLATAGLLLAWYLAGSGFSPTGAAVTLATVGCLAALGVMQLGVGRGLETVLSESVIYKS